MVERLCEYHYPTLSFQAALAGDKNELGAAFQEVSFPIDASSSAPVPRLLRATCEPEAHACLALRRERSASRDRQSCFVPPASCACPGAPGNPPSPRPCSTRLSPARFYTRKMKLRHGTQARPDAVDVLCFGLHTSSDAVCPPPIMGGSTRLRISLRR